MHNRDISSEIPQVTQINIYAARGRVTVAAAETSTAYSATTIGIERISVVDR